MWEPAPGATRLLSSWVLRQGPSSSSSCGPMPVPQGHLGSVSSWKSLRPTGQTGESRQRRGGVASRRGDGLSCPQPHHSACPQVWTAGRWRDRAAAAELGAGCSFRGPAGCLPPLRGPSARGSLPAVLRVYEVSVHQAHHGQEMREDGHREGELGSNQKPNNVLVIELGRGHGPCKGPGAGPRLVCWNNSEVAGVAGAE